MAALWPKDFDLVGPEGIVATLQLGPRAISVDVAEEPEEVETQTSVVGRRNPEDGSIEWMLGSLREVVAGTSEAISHQAAIQYITGCELGNKTPLPVFLRKGTTFRLYALASPAPADTKQATNTSVLAGEAQAADTEVDDPQSGPGGARGRRAREKYSQAVAFEFVSCVMDNILADQPDSEKDPSAPSIALMMQSAAHSS